MEVEKEQKGNVLIVRVSGGIEIRDSNQAIQALKKELRRSSSSVVLNLGVVDFMDSWGISALLALETVVTDSGRAFLIGPVSEAVREVLTITGVDRHLKIYPSEDGAVRCGLVSET